MKPGRVIWRLVTYIPRLYTINTLAWIGVYLMNLAPGWLAKLFFDNLTEAAPVRFDVNGVLVLVMIAAFVHVAFITTGFYLDTESRFSHSLLLRRNSFAALLQRPGADAFTGSAGEVISTFRDDVQALENVTDWFIDAVGQIIFAILVVTVMVSISWRVTLLTLLPLVVVLLLVRAASTRIKQYRAASRRATERVTGALGEVLSAVQAIQVANAEQLVQAHVRRLNEQRRHMMVRDSVLTEILQSIFNNSAALGTGLILIVTANAMREGTFTVGDFALFVAYLEQMAVFTTYFGGYLAQLKQAEVSFERLEKLLAYGATNQEKETIAKALVAHNPTYLKGDLPDLTVPTVEEGDMLHRLEVQGLSYRYGERQPGIEDISFTLAAGSFTVITGRVGAGKTTLLRTILGLLPATAGEVWWNGRLVTNPAAFLVPPRTAYTSQVPHLFSMRLDENILLGWPDEAIDEAIAQAVLAEDVARMPDGLATMVGPKGVRLSGGQIQRTAAARMLVRRPSLYLFDDLSSALDVATEQRLWQGLMAENGRTFLVVSHRRVALQQADQIILLQNGRVADIGSLERLLARSNEMQQLWREGQGIDN